MKVAVTGGDGVLAQALREFLPDATYLSRRDCDVRNFDAVRIALCDAWADVVVHAAALTNHQHPDAGAVIETNIIGTANVAQWCSMLDTRLVYLSTHYVYPGARGNYVEHDEPRPIGTYAWSKLAGEEFAKEVQNTLIVRGSWYTQRRVALWARQGALTDAYTNREPVRDAARKIAALIRADVCGVVNIGGARRTFYDIARAELPEGTPIKPASREDFNAALGTGAVPYAFPRDSSVSTAKFDALGLKL